MNHEGVTLGEISQSQKDKYCTIPLTWSTLSSQSHRDRENDGCQAPGGGGARTCLMGTELRFCQMEGVLEVQGGDGCTAVCLCFYCHWLCSKMTKTVNGTLRMLLAARSCLTLCDPMDCSLPGSSVHGVSQARKLKWVAMSSSRGSSQPRDQTQVFYIAGRFFTVWVTREDLCYASLTTIGRKKKAVSESRDAKAEVKRVKKEGDIIGHF